MEAQKEPFEVVYEKHFSNIYNFIYGQILHRERAEDLVSDIFIKAMTNYDRFDPSRASVRTWLTNIARNTLIDEYRKSGKRNTVSLDDEENEVDPSYEDEYSVFQEATEKEVRELLQKLNEGERELVGMLYFQKMKNDEIGAVLGINAKAVSERHRRLLAKLRKIVAQEKMFEY
ncbi:MAG: sigma-70 family RNA polymerase sigma factor [Blautia sp.]|nr:sigma-70 family RNA polymerase sigma factor [Blautia sp.]